MRQHNQDMNFQILEQKVINGVMYVYVKTPGGFYGWYRLDLVELPEEGTV